MRPRQERAAVLLLIVVFILLAAASAARQSATIDESAHLPAGIYAWKTGDFSLYAKTPPLGRMIICLPALLFHPRLAPDLSPFPPTSWQPWEYAADFLARNPDAYGRCLFSSRLMTISAGAFLLFLIWREARKRYGPLGAMISLAAGALSPTMIAHSRLITTDLPAALSSFIVVLALLSYLRRPSFSAASLLACAFGFALLTKFSSLFFLPFLIMAPPAGVFLARCKERPNRLLSQAILHLILVCSVSWIILLAGYQGKGIGGHEKMKISSRSLTPLAKIFRRAPLPRDFISGLDQQMYDAEAGEWSRGNYLWGEWYGGNKWYYYLAAVLVKEPVPYLVLLALSVVMVFRRKPRAREELILLFILAGYFTAISLFGSLQLGLRYLLPAYPLAFVLMGKTGMLFSAEGKTADVPRRRTVRLTFLLFAAWLLIDHVMIFPHYLAYFNALAGGPANGSKYLLDSNLDWGQELPGLARWMKKQGVDRIDLAYFGHDDPHRFGIIYDLPGHGSPNRYLAVSAQLLFGRRYPMTFVRGGVSRDDPLWTEIHRFKKVRPADHVGWCIFIFDRGERR